MHLQAEIAADTYRWALSAYKLGQITRDRLIRYLEALMAATKAI